MNRTVYLFELDSVNKFRLSSTTGVTNTPAMKALFSEIINNGNSVAISMNQLTDSQFIRETLSDDFAFSCILKLFRCGAIKVSLYNDIKSVSQYVQNAIEKCLSNTEDTFIFSNLPVKNNETQLLVEILNALKFSNLSTIQNIILNSPQEEKERLKLIYRFIYVVLQISIYETSYILPKQTSKRSFEELMSIIINLLNKSDFSHIDGITKVADYLNQLNSEMTIGRNNRSNWLNFSTTEPHILLANKIINICYNYAIEDSINGVTKHYDDSNFEKTFLLDFKNRIELSFSQHNSSNEEKTQTITRQKWNTLVRFAEYKSKLKKDPKVSSTYETSFFKERHQWIIFILSQNISSFLLALLYIIIFIYIEFSIDFISSLFSISINDTFVSSLITIVFWGIFSSFINIILTKIIKKDFPDILKNIINIGLLVYDFLYLLGAKNDSYKLS